MQDHQPVLNCTNMSTPYWVYFSFNTQFCQPTQSLSWSTVHLTLGIKLLPPVRSDIFGHSLRTHTSTYIMLLFLASLASRNDYLFYRHGTKHDGQRTVKETPKETLSLCLVRILPDRPIQNSKQPTPATPSPKFRDLSFETSWGYVLSSPTARVSVNRPVRRTLFSCLFLSVL